MRHGLYFAVLLAAGAAAGAERPAVGLLTEFPPETTSWLREEFQRETERALAPAGGMWVWRDLGGTARAESFDRIVVVRVRGACSLPAEPGRRRGRALGLTHVSDGRILPFVEIDCRKVVEALDERGVAGGFAQPAAVLGRALGRVAAHEIHHVLTASSTHERSGLMKASFNRQDLRGEVLEFSASALLQLRISLGTEVAPAVLESEE